MTEVSSQTGKIAGVDADKRRRKRRTPEEKYGKYKWIRVLLRRAEERDREILRMLRGITLHLLV